MSDWVKQNITEEELNENEILNLTDNHYNSQNLKPMLRSKMRKNATSLSPTIEQKEEEDE